MVAGGLGADGRLVRAGGSHADGDGVISGAAEVFEEEDHFVVAVCGGEAGG